MRLINNQKQKGFTLLELLIAISIFSTAIVLVVGSFGISLKHQREIRANRDVSLAGREVLNEISRQIELSLNGPIQNREGRFITQANRRIYNFAVVSSPGDETAVGDNSAPRGVLFIRGEDNHCRYFVLQNNRVAVYIDKNAGCGTEGEAVDYSREPFYLTDENIIIDSLEFKSVTNRQGKGEQGYILARIEFKNADSSEYLIPMEVKTAAAIRNYGQEE